MELAQGSEAQVNDTDHATHGEPAFVSASDFHEVLGSPTVDAGTVDAASGQRDLDGLPRIFGPGEDIGAYESQVLPAKPVVSAPVVVGAPAGGPSVPPAPGDSSLRLSATRFRAARKGATVSASRARIGTTISYSDSQAAITTFSIQRPVAGVRSGRACVAPPHRRHHKPCVRFLTLGSFAHRDAVGVNRLRFSGRVRGRRLAPNAYRLTAVPRNSAGESGQAVVAGFTIIA